MSFKSKVKRLFCAHINHEVDREIFPTDPDNRIKIVILKCTRCGELHMINVKMGDAEYEKFRKDIKAEGFNGEEAKRSEVEEADL